MTEPAETRSRRLRKNTLSIGPKQANLHPEPKLECRSAFIVSYNNDMR